MNKKIMTENNRSKMWKIQIWLMMVAVTASIASADENDQYWMTGGIKWNATDHVSLKVAQQARYKDEKHYYNQTDLGIGYQFNKQWSLTAIYRYSGKKNKAGNWQETDGYLLDLVNTTNGWGAQLQTRIRGAYFDRRYDTDCSTELRPKFTLSPQKGITDWQWKPYIADEFMYNLDEDLLYKNRLSCGLKCKPNESLSLDLFVMQERTEKNHEWSENWNSGLSATFSF